MDRERDWKKLKMSLEDPCNLLTKPRVVREKARNKLRCSVSVDQPDKAVSKAMRSCLLMLHSRRLIRAAPSSGRGDVQVMVAASPLLSKANSSTFERSFQLDMHSRRLIRAAPSSGRGVIQIMAVKYHLLYKGISSTFERSCYNY